MSKPFSFILLGAGSAFCFLAYFLKPNKEDFVQVYLSTQVESSHSGVKGFLDSTKKALSLAFNLNDIQIYMVNLGICYCVNVRKHDDPTNFSLYIGAFRKWLRFY